MTLLSHSEIISVYSIWFQLAFNTRKTEDKNSVLSNVKILTRLSDYEKQEMWRVAHSIEIGGECA